MCAGSICQMSQMWYLFCCQAIVSTLNGLVWVNKRIIVLLPQITEAINSSNQPQMPLLHMAKKNVIKVSRMLFVLVRLPWSLHLNCAISDKESLLLHISCSYCVMLKAYASPCLAKPFLHPICVLLLDTFWKNQIFFSFIREPKQQAHRHKIT